MLKSHFLPKPVWGKGDFHKVVNKFHEKLNRCYSQSVLPAPPAHYHQRNPNRIIPALAPKNCPRFTATCPPSAGETPCGRENPSDCPTISAPISQKHRCYCHTKLSHPNLHTFPYKFDAVKQAHSSTQHYSTLHTYNSNSNKGASERLYPARDTNKRRKKMAGANVFMARTIAQGSPIAFASACTMVPGLTFQSSKFK